MRILILDDDPIRHQAFAKIYAGHEIVSVHRFYEFKRQVKDRQDWDIIHLDHDLGDHTTADTFVDGWGSTQEFTGLHAARVLIGMLDWQHLPSVIIHSINSVGANQMKGELRSADFDVKWEPFGEAG